MERRRQLRFANFLTLFLGIFFIVSCADIARADTLAEHDITVDTVWSKDLGPYTVGDAVTIHSGATLFIEPGIVINMAGAPFKVYGTLRIGDTTATTSEKILFHGPFSLLVFGGKVESSGADIRMNNFIIIDQNGSFDFNDSTLSGGYINSLGQSRVTFTRSALTNMTKIRVLGQSTARCTDSTINGFEGFLLRGQSQAYFKNVNITDVFADTAFSVQQQSKLFFENSQVSPVFSDFALLIDGSHLSATSTHIDNIERRGIDAIRGVTVNLHDVTMMDILSTASYDSFFIELIGSRANITKSRFSGTFGNALELYSSNTVPRSTLHMSDSTISDYGESGVYAVHATGTIQDSVIEKGARGIENIYSYLSVSNSRISENSEYGAVAYIPTHPLHAENNYWGSESGPAGIISGHVLAVPWLSSDPTQPCCSSVMFLPGFMASRLYSTSENGSEFKIWEPKTWGGAPIRKLFLDSAGNSIEDNIYTRDVINEALISEIGPNIYKSFMTDMDILKSTEVISDWKSIPYDWRFSVDDILKSGDVSGSQISYIEPTTSPYIIKELKELADESKTGKVTIVSHSNGGLLAKALMLELRDRGLEYLIDKLIMVAVPQVGTPQAVGALLHGFGQGMPEQAPVLAPPKLMRAFGLDMPGAYSLIPSALYFESVTDPLITFRTPLATSSLTHFFTGLDGRPTPPYADLMSPAILNPLLIARAENLHSKIDSWLPPHTLRIIQIAGWGIDTLKGLRYYNIIKKGISKVRYEPLFTEDGDQTVVVPSALVMATGTPSVSRYWLNLETANETEFPDRSHADILEVSDLRKFVKDTIAHTSAELPASISTSSPTSTYGKKLQFLLYGGTATMHMYDTEGNHTGISTSTGLVEQSIPDTTYRQLGDVIYMTIPQKNIERMGKRSAPRIVITYSPPIMTELDSPDETSDATYTLEVSETIGNTTTSSTSFSDVPVTEQSVSVLEITPSIDELESLQVDVENDGVTDFRVRPNETFEPSPDASIQRDVARTLSRSGSRARTVPITATTTTANTAVTVVPTPLITILNIATATRAVLSIATVTIATTTKSVITLDKTASLFGAIGEGRTRHFLYGVMSRIKNFMNMVMIRLSA